ncbi:MAG: hypothetical protein ACK4HV_03310 [Parachlamydiaceae bacterium]
MIKYFLLLSMLLSIGPSREERIEQLKEEIRLLRIKALNNEVQGQENLRYHGNLTVSDVEKAENYEDQAEQKEKELRELLEQK